MKIISRGSRKIQKFIIICILIGMSVYIHIKFNSPVKYVIVNMRPKMPCVLPRLNPWDQEVMKFTWKPHPIICKSWLSLMYVDAGGFLHLNETAVTVEGHRKLTCKYAYVHRTDDYHIQVSEEVIFTSPVYVPSDVIYVKCKNDKDQIVYEYVLENIDNVRVEKTKKLEEESKDQISVIIIGVDSLSRLAAERNLPRTIDFLKRNLSAYVLEGYTKIGEATFPNLVGLFTGKAAFSKELPPHTALMDTYPFIWNKFSKKGYVTYHAEDWARIATLSLYSGFVDSPCDHYFRPFFHAIDKFQPFLNSFDASVLQYLENKNMKLTDTSSLCYGNKPKHQIMIDHHRRFIDVYKNKRKFSFSWFNEIGHEFSSFVQLTDTDFLDFFKWLKEKGTLESSILIFMSDHGITTTDIRNTVMGRIEALMPLLAISIPGHLKSKYPQIDRHLTYNTRQLTTPFDLHETLKDILNSNFLERETSDSKKLTNSSRRGISLFEKITSNRSCYDAGIEDMFCPCYSVSNTSVDQKHVQEMAKHIVAKLNEYLKDYWQKCASLTLNKIKSVHKIKTNTQRVEEKEKFSLRNLFYKDRYIEQKQQYIVAMETVPGHGLFEATVIYIDSHNVKLLGGISRINKYGNQSSCVRYTTVRSYCYCIRDR